MTADAFRCEDLRATAFVKTGENTNTEVKRLPTPQLLLSKSEDFAAFATSRGLTQQLSSGCRSPAKILANTGFRAFPGTIVLVATACDDTAAFPNNQLSRPQRVFTRKGTYEKTTFHCPLAVVCFRNSGSSSKRKQFNHNQPF